MSKKHDFGGMTIDASEPIRTSWGGPAFPVSHDMALVAGLQNAYGMTLRDYFAAKALQGMMASRSPNTPRFHPEDDAAYVYAIADAMLKARQ